MNNEINKNENEELILEATENLPTEEAVAVSDETVSTEAVAPTENEALPEVAKTSDEADSAPALTQGDEGEEDVTEKGDDGLFDGEIAEEPDIQEAEESDSGEFIFDTEAEPTFELIETEEAIEPMDTKDTEEENESEEEPTTEEPVPAPEEKKKPKRERKVGARGIDTAFDFLELFIFTLVGVLIVTSFLFRHSVVSGDSMQNTLQDGDRLIISDLFYEPEYGDIIVVEDRTAGIASPIVKRVIAVGGDKVRVTPAGIDVNDVALTEDYVYTDGFNYYYELEPYAFRDNDTLVFVPGEYYEFIVPEGELFVLGDHRNNSSDSRVYGTVREDAVLGRLIVRFFPFNEFEFFIFK